MDGSFQTIRRNAKAMFGSALIVQSISAAVLGVMSVGLIGLSADLQVSETRPSDSEFMGAMFSFLGVSVVVTVLAIFLGAVLQGVMVVPVSRSVLNRRTGFKQMWSLARSRILTLVGLGATLFLAYVVAVGGLVGLGVVLVASLGPAGGLLIVPLALGGFVVSIWLTMKLLVAPAAVVVEDLPVFQALRRSWQLTKQNWWRIFAITLVVALLVGVIGQVVLLPISLATGGITAVVAPHGGPVELTTVAVIMTIASVVVSALVGAVAFAFQTSVMALIYVDLRMRHDGLDVELLRMLETGADPDGIPGRPSPHGSGHATG